MLKSVKATFHRAVWETDITRLPRLEALYVRALRTVYTVVQESLDGHLNLRAMSLVYTTLLAMVPLLAVSFSVLKSFGVHNQLEQVMQNLMVPLGESGLELTAQILTFVDNIKVGVLGSVGLVLLFYTSVAMVYKVESAFNSIWRVTRPRTLAERVRDYVSVLVVGPVLMFGALGLTATISSTSLFQQFAAVEAFGVVVRALSQLLPFLMVCAASVFVYFFMPNTRVQIGAALSGGLIAAVLWKATGSLFAWFVVWSSGYTAIYSGFAILIFFMIWIYLSWLILLAGAAVSFYTQNPEYLGVRPRGLRLSNRLRERVALQILYLIGCRYYEHHPGWTTAELSRQFDVPGEPLRRILRGFEVAGFLVVTRGEPPRYLPGRDLGEITVNDVLESVRRAEERTQVGAQRIRSEPVVDRVMATVDRATAEALNEMTVKDMVDGAAAPVVNMAVAQGERDSASEPGIGQQGKR